MQIDIRSPTHSILGPIGYGMNRNRIKFVYTAIKRARTAVSAKDCFPLPEDCPLKSYNFDSRPPSVTLRWFVPSQRKGMVTKMRVHNKSPTRQRADAHERNDSLLAADLLLAIGRQQHLSFVSVTLGEMKRNLFSMKGIQDYRIRSQGKTKYPALPFWFRR